GHRAVGGGLDRVLGPRHLQHDGHDGRLRRAARLAGPDVRVQVLVLAWAFGALLEGLVGFGYPWAVVAPILIGLGMSDLAALRAAALGNTTPVSYGALG